MLMGRRSHTAHPSETHNRIPAALPTAGPVTMACAALAWGACCLAATAAERGATPGKKVDFNFQVRPILSDKCFNCHGPDPRQRKAGLRLDTKEGAFGTNKSGGHAIVPGNLEDSDLVGGSPPRMRASGCLPSRWAVRCPPRRSTFSSGGSSKGPSGSRTGRSCRQSRHRSPRSRTRLALEPARFVCPGSPERQGWRRPRGRARSV